MDRGQKKTETPGRGPGSKARDAGGRSKASVGLLQHKIDYTIDRFSGTGVDTPELLLVPHDLLTSDPSLMSEINSGHFGLDGMFVELEEGGASIFEHPDTDDSYNRILHGFSWLRDLRARDDFEAQQEAQRLVFKWMGLVWQPEDIAYEPEVLARRITSLLSNSSFVLRGVRKDRTRRYMRTLLQQVVELHSKLGETPGGLSRLRVLSALVMAGLCLSRQNDRLAEVTPLLMEELGEQIYPDGGHCSRNPAAILHILFEILPLRQGFISRGKDVPPELDKAIRRMLPMIRFFRLGDSSLARFNGASTTPTDALATLLAYDERNRPFDAHAKDSGYTRIQEGPVTILCDVGAPPSLSGARLAHAGCLSFEMTVRHVPLIVNSGAYQGEDRRWRQFARSTQAHSTLVLDDYSSGSFDEKGRLTGPTQINIDRADLSGLDAIHHGYERQFGLLHRRQMILSHEGLRLEGVDSLEGVGHAGEAPLSIRFHLHPRIELARSDEDNLLMTLPDGEIWRFHAKGAHMEMDDSVYLAYRRGPQPAHQIVLQGKARAGMRVDWLFEQYRARPNEG